ncbi:MAG: hypothetical protein AB8B78_12600 [Polaribacter sp.]
MKIKLFFFLFLLIITFGCSDGNGCVDRVTIPDNVEKTASGFTFTPSSWIDLPCDYDLSNLLDVSEVSPNFSFEIVSFKFTPDTGKNTSKLEFEVKLTNNCNKSIEGLPIFIMRIDGVESSKNYIENTNNCTSFTVNETCNFNYSKETSLETGKVKSLELVAVKFLLAK